VPVSRVPVLRNRPLSCPSTISTICYEEQLGDEAKRLLDAVLSDEATNFHKQKPIPLAKFKSKFAVSPRTLSSRKSLRSPTAFNSFNLYLQISFFFKPRRCSSSASFRALIIPNRSQITDLKAGIHIHTTIITGTTRLASIQHNWRDHCASK
jgi:hypothetical protein